MRRRKSDRSDKYRERVKKTEKEWYGVMRSYKDHHHFFLLLSTLSLSERRKSENE